jgi:hypothetical protein
VGSPLPLGPDGTDVAQAIADGGVVEPDGVVASGDVIAAGGVAALVVNPPAATKEGRDA